MKKILTVSGVLIVFGAIGVGVYFGLQGAKQAAIPGQSSGGGSFPVSSGGAGNSSGIASGQSGQSSPSDSGAAAIMSQNQKNNLFQLTTNPAVAFWVASSTPSASGIIHASVYYLNAKGDVIQIQDVGKEQIIASSPFGMPLQLWQNKDGSRIVALFDSGVYALFTLTTKVWQALPENVTSVAFSPDGTKLAYLLESAGRSTLYTRTLTSARTTGTLVTSLALVDAMIAWPSPSRVFILSKPSAQIDGEAWYFDMTAKTLTYFGHGYGLQLVFDYVKPYSVIQLVSSQGQSVQASLLDQDGKQIGDSSHLLTVADKCVFSSDGARVFCALPRENNKNTHVVFPDDYLKNAVYFHDALFEISAKNFSSVTPVINTSDIALDMVFLRSTPTQLFFMNRIDRTLYLYNLSGL
jgi:WD40 repeat protein